MPLTTVIMFPANDVVHVQVSNGAMDGRRDASAVQVTTSVRWDSRALRLSEVLTTHNGYTSDEGIVSWHYVTIEPGSAESFELRMCQRSNQPPIIGAIAIDSRAFGFSDSKQVPPDFTRCTPELESRATKKPPERQ